MRQHKLSLDNGSTSPMHADASLTQSTQMHQAQSKLLGGILHMPTVTRHGQTRTSHILAQSAFHVQLSHP